MQIKLFHKTAIKLETAKKLIAYLGLVYGQELSYFQVSLSWNLCTFGFVDYKPNVVSYAKPQNSQKMQIPGV